jgi:hypothetical protein
MPLSPTAAIQKVRLRAARLHSEGKPTDAEFASAKAKLI